MSKQRLIDQIITQLSQAAEAAALAADEAHQNATYAESAAETQYDTLGLENAYLAHGQSMRLDELQQAIAHYRQLPVRAFSEDDEIALGALVEATSDTGNSRWFFIGPMQGGLQLSWEDHPVTLITPQTPVGTLLIGRYLDDEVELPGSDGVSHYVINSLL